MGVAPIGFALGGPGVAGDSGSQEGEWCSLAGGLSWAAEQTYIAGGCLHPGSVRGAAAVAHWRKVPAIYLVYTGIVITPAVAHRVLDVVVTPVPRF